MTPSFLNKSSDSVSCIDYFDAHLDQTQLIGKSVEFDFINEDRSILSWPKGQGTRYATSVCFFTQNENLKALNGIESRYTRKFVTRSQVWSQLTTPKFWQRENAWALNIICCLHICEKLYL